MAELVQGRGLQALQPLAGVEQHIHERLGPIRSAPAHHLQAQQCPSEAGAAVLAGGATAPEPDVGIVGPFNGLQGEFATPAGEGGVDRLAPEAAEAIGLRIRLDPDAP